MNTLFVAFNMNIIGVIRQEETVPSLVQGGQYAIASQYANPDFFNASRKARSRRQSYSLSTVIFKYGTRSHKTPPELTRYKMPVV